MTGSDVLHMLLGAAFVSIGFLSAALAERIRGTRSERAAIAQEPSPRASASRRERGTHRSRTVIPVVDLRDPNPPSPPREPVVISEASEDGGDDVIAALVATGYKKAIATEATWACSAAERATVEGWTAAALRRCARGGAS